jgi:hypothetical protein
LPEEIMKTQLTGMKILTAGTLALAVLPLFASPIGIAAAQDQRPAAAPAITPIAPHPSTQEPAHRMTFEQVVAMEQSLSNWGRWGKDDERGTLNLVTPEKTKQALALVKDAAVVSLARFASLEKTIDDFNFGPTKHEMWYGLAGPPKPGETRGALDTISYGIHDGTNSHLDALCHYTLLRDGKVVVYNGHPSATEKGCSKNAIDRMGPGFATRAVLVDMPLLKGVEWLDPHTPIYPEDLEAWEKFANVKIGSGDAVLIRTGRWALRAAKGPWPQAREAAGLHGSVMPLAQAARYRAACRRCRQRRAALRDRRRLRRGGQSPCSSDLDCRHGHAAGRQRLLRGCRQGSCRAQAVGIFHDGPADRT